MSTENGPIDFQIIRDMLYDDDAYVKEFCDASVISFSEFKSNFRKNVMDNDLETLRRTGHKIKPVAKMLKLDLLLEIYEKSKLLLMEGGDPELQEKYASEMDEYCEEILNQLHQRTK
jgi:HPt (histidine-containing phosphotransfer) domain-containing protein